MTSLQKREKHGKERGETLYRTVSLAQRNRDDDDDEDDDDDDDDDAMATI